MNRIVIEAIGSLLQVVVASLALAAIVKLDTSLSLKALIGVAIFLVLLLLARLNNLGQLLREILHYQRVTFISVETARLDPKHLKPAQDLIIEDLKEEETRQRFRYIAGGGVFPDFVAWGVFVVAVGITTWIILRYWHVL